MDMFQTIYRAPDYHQGPLSLGGGFSTDVKGLSLKFGFLGESIFAKARQLCWNAGPSFSVEKRREIEDKITEFYREQRAEAERLYGKNPQLYTRDDNKRWVAGFHLDSSTFWQKSELLALGWFSSIV